MNIKTKITYIKERVSIGQVFDLYHIKRGATEYSCHCPFHGDDKHASGSIKNGFFHCFTCGEKLDVISFVQKMNNCTLLEALQFLDKSFALGTFKLHWKDEKKIRDILRQRDYELKRAKERELWYSKKLAEIAQELDFWATVQRDYEPKFYEILNNSWDGRWYFVALKRQMELNHLYDALMTKSYYERKNANKTQINWAKDEKCK